MVFSKFLLLIRYRHVEFRFSCERNARLVWIELDYMKCMMYRQYVIVIENEDHFIE